MTNGSRLVSHPHLIWFLQDSAASTPPDLSFERYMARLLYQPGGMTSDGTPGPANVAWINALVGRLLYDFLRNPYWANKVKG